MGLLTTPRTEECKREIGRRLLDLQVQAGLSNHQLATLMGCSDRALWSWMRGEKVTVDCLIMFSDAFGITVSDLLEGL